VSSMIQLMKWRVARGASDKPSQQSCTEGTDIRESYPYWHFGYREFGKKESGVLTCELARLRFVTSAFGMKPWS
jgi:hypothetical protein